MMLSSPGLSQAAQTSGGISVADFRGKTITLRKPAERIVCLIESALSGIYMLGEERRVIGISRNVYDGTVFPFYAAMDERIRTRRLSSPGNWDFVSIESVLALRPDLVIIWSKQTESIRALEERGIPVFGVFITKREDVHREMRALGVLTGSSSRAEDLIAYTEGEIGRFRKRISAIPQGKTPGIYFMWAQGMLETSCGESTVNDLIRLSGGRNVCAGLPHEHTVVNVEQVIAWNPDLIVMWYNERKNPADVTGDPQWRVIRAVKSRRVHEFPEVFLCDLWTLKYVFAVKMVAKWAHPEMFSDIDLAKEKASMLRKLYGGRLSPE